MADGSKIALNTRSRPIRIADLFCGAGGSSTGALRALRSLGRPVELTAVNHWPVAIETHTRNHPEAIHFCADLETARPRELVPGGRLDLLIASPTCTFHSRARGGRPVNDQQRMDPWHVVRWCTELRVARLMIENVPEFVEWGPCSLVTGRPIPSRRGEYFRAWCEALRAIGYRLDHRVLCCADYGDPTTRNRFFLIGRSDGKALRWPEPSHARGGKTDLLGQRERWRAASEIIDWSTPGKSIFTRKIPLKPNTLRRILAGAIRYRWPQPYIEALEALLAGREPVLDIQGDAAAPFMVSLRGTSDVAINGGARDVGQPVPTIAAQGKHVGLVMATASGGAARSVSDPLPTITTGGNGKGNARPHFITPLLVSKHGGPGNTARGTDEPAYAVDTGGGGSLAQPLIVPITHAGQRRVNDVECPLPTITGANRGELALVAPYYGGGSGLTSQSVDDPVPAITTKARFGLAEPILMRAGHGGDARKNPSAHVLKQDAPLPSLTGGNEVAIAQPLVVELSNSSSRGVPRPASAPLTTITMAKGGDKALAQPASDGVRIDILYRMLHWRELARAMSFDDEGEVYEFAGTSTEITKQIGNAVPGRTAKALVQALMGSA